MKATHRSHIWLNLLLLASLLLTLTPVEALRASVSEAQPVPLRLPLLMKTWATPQTPTQDPPPGWLDRITKDVARAEYEVTWQDTTPLADARAAYQATNRAQNLRVYFTPDSLHLVPRTTTDPMWMLNLTVTGSGSTGVMQQVAGAKLEAAGNGVQYDRGDLVEWYVNHNGGLEQGFTLFHGPSGDGVQLVIDMVYTGDLQARLVEEGAAVEFTAAGVRVLRYGAVHAYDATGAALPAYLELEDTHIRLVVDAAHAVYPLTIDPLFTTPDWAVEGPQTDAGFGAAVSTIGDVNGDGYSDVVIGAPDFDGGETDEGKVFVYYGSVDGPSTTAGWTVEGNQAGAHLGADVSLAGDVNGDGYGDLVVSAPDYDDAQADVGAVYVYFGSGNGLSATPDWTAVGDQASARFGGAVRLAGDVNGDGYSDIVIGAPDYDAGATDTGKAFVYQGSASGLGGTPDWTVAGDQAAAYFGAAVAAAGDVNSDGYADVIVGAPYYDNGETDEGRVFVYHGSSAGLSASANWTAEGNQAGASFGTAVAPAGDVNGDGYADVIVGAPAYDNGQTDEGRAFVYHGSATGLGASAAWTAESDQAEAHLGAAVGTVGDLTGDGYADVVVGIPEYDGGQTDEGRLYVYAGSASGLSSACVWALESDQAGARLGAAVGVAGDVDGDGWSDVIAGAPDYDGTQNNLGRAYVVRGSTLDVAGSPGWTLEANQASAHLGYFVATAGDIDGDGYADVVVGAPDYDNGQSNEGRAYVFLGAATGLNTTPHQVLEINQANAHFGVSVGTAGDVNGDGYSDLIVGADGYDNGQTDEGAAFVYYGSAGGLNATPAWQVESNQASAEFGYWVSTAGDVNGDGYADVIVGAYTYDNGETDEGAAFVYHGSAGGLSSTPDWMAEGNQANAQYGVAVNSAGDVNGDGYSDVLVGAYWYDGTYTNEGRAELFLGSANGLNSTPAWSVVGGQANAYLGDTVASAGDVNGDGYADVVVGAYGYDNGQTNEGRAYVYYGSASGLGATPDWVNESNATSANYGTAAATAGDVNGDGYADVIIGAKFESHGQLSEGRAYLYLGGPTGLATTASWTAESNQALANFGGSVGTAGDVNGDGYADVVVGAGWYESSWLQLDEGYAALYYGNGGNGGLGARSRQRRLDDTAPIAPGGQSDGAGVQIALTGRTPLGRAAARLQWQIAPLGTPFTATTGVVVGTAPGWTALWSTGTEITQSVTGLASGTSYHWRVRWLYAPDNALGQPAGRWLHVPWNGWLETDFRTATVAETPISGLAAVNDGPTTLGEVTTLTATVSAGSNVNYTWAFGDGDTSAGASVTHTYPGVGLYTAVVTASNSANTVTATTTITVNDVAITGLTAVNDSPTTLGQATTLTATVSAGSNVVYTWDFGDGEMGSGAGVTHTYTTADTHIAVVTATNNTNSVTTTTTVTVIPGGDTAITGLMAVNDSPTTLGQATTLTATVSAGSNVSYTWAFGDGSTDSGAVVAHTYPVAESYTAVVTATNSANTVTATTGATILPPTYIPQAAFTALPVAGYAPFTVQFSNYSVHATAYGWDFGDGFTSTAISPTHVYTTAGIYTPTLTVTGTGGADSLVRPAYITVLTLNATPQITIVSPAEGAVIGAGVVQVTGNVSDDAPPKSGNVVTGVWVNDVAATLNGAAFTATLTLSSGNHILYAVAEDAQGAYGTDTSVVRVDGEGPLVTIHTPRTGQAVYTLAPTVNISYTDFYTEVNVNTLSVTLRDTNAVVTDVTAVFTVGASGASGSLSALATETSYTLTASISDTLGNTGTAAITFYVPQDAATLTPPALPEAPGWVSGRVYDARTCDVYLTTCEGLPGVHVTVQSIDHATRETTDNVTGTVVTGPDGFYAFPIAASGTYALRFTKAGYTYSQREVAVIRERSTAVNAVYLTGLDTATTYLSYPITQTQVHTSADGKLRLEFPPGALASGQTVTVTATNFEHVEFLPSGELPPGTWETYAFNLGGDSEVHFTQPITVMVANARGFAPGTMIPLGYWNQTTLQWEHVGVGVVDAAGAWVVMQVEHFSNFDCNDPIAPPPTLGGLLESENGNHGKCSSGEEGCFIDLKSGQVREWIELPGVNVLGEMMAPSLEYNTAYAYPSAVIDTRLDLNFDDVLVAVEHVQFELYIEGEKTETFTFAADADGSGEVGRYRLLWDGRDAQDQLVSPGVHAYAVKMSVPYDGEYYWSQTGTFGGPPDPSRPTGVTVTATQDYWIYGTVELNPQTDSALGSGWVMEDVQRLYIDDADQIVIADGSELTEYAFEARVDEVEIPQYGVTPPPVAGRSAAIEFTPVPTTVTEVSGTLTANTVWTVENSPYVITGTDVIVPDGITLTVEPGVTVLLGQHNTLRAYGELDAVGLVTRPITFAAYIGGTYNEYWVTYTLDIPNIVAADVDQDGRLWSGTPLVDLTPLRLLSFDATTGSQELDQFGLLSGLSQLHDLAADEDNRVWLAHDRYLTKFIPNRHIIDYTRYSYPGDDVFAVATDDERGYIWVGTESGVLRYTPSTNTWLEITATSTTEVYAIAVDEGSGDVWLATDAGLSRCTVDGDDVHTYTYPLVNAANDVALDLDGNVWLSHYDGIDGNGISVLRTDETWVTYTLANETNLITDTVVSVAVDTQNRKWLGYASDGVSILSADETTWQTVGTTSKLGADNVVDIVAVPDGSVWVVGCDNADACVATHIYEGTYERVVSGGHWGYVQIGGGANLEDSDGSHLRHVVLESGGLGFKPSLYVKQSAPMLDNLTVRGSGGDGIHIEDSSGTTLMTVTVESNAGDGVQISGEQGEHTLGNVTAQHNQNYGIFVQNTGVALTVRDSLIASNGIAARLPLTTTLQDNVWLDNQHNHIEWLGGTMDTASTWDMVDTYVVVESIEVSSDVTLTIVAGTTVLFDDSTELRVKGNLQAVGTAVAPIYFGAVWPDKRPYFQAWYGVVLGDSQVWDDCNDTHLRYVTVADASDGLYVNRCSPTLEHLTLFANDEGIVLNGVHGITIAHSNFVGEPDNTSWKGVRVATGTPSNDVTISDSNFVGDDDDDVAIQANPVYCDGLVIHNSNFIGENFTGLETGGETTITENYWGSPTGPNVNGTGQPGCGAIIDIDTDMTTYEPWLTSLAHNDAPLGYVIVNRTATDHTTLIYDESSGTYTRLYPDGKSVHFDAQGYHDYTLLPDGRQTVYSYTVDGALSAMGVITPGGSAPVWTWDFTYQDGKLSRITDPAGRATNFTVDEHNHLTQVTFPDASTRQFYYDERGLLTQQVDPTGQATEYVYDSYGHLTQHIAPATTVYTPATGETSVFQAVRTFTPSNSQGLIDAYTAPGTPDNPATAVLTSTALVDGVTYADGSTRSGHTNAWGSLVDETDALGRTMVYERDDANNLTKVTFPDGSCLEGEYDENGSAISAMRVSAEQCALAPEERDPELLQGSSRTLESRYGLPKTVTNAAGDVMTYTYDYEVGQGEAGRVVRIDYPPMLDANGVLTTPFVAYTYNSLGLVETERAIQGTVTRYTYTLGTADEAFTGATPLFLAGVTPVPGLLTQVTADDGGYNYITQYKGFSALGDAQTTIYPGGALSTTTYFDELGRVITQTDTSGIVTLYEYDPAGRIARQVVDYTADGITGANIETTYAYNGAGLRMHQRTVAGGLIDETFFYYDALGRLVAEADGLGNTTRYFYNAAGQLIETRDPLGYSTIYTYTNSGQLLATADPTGSVTRQSYDALGRVTETVQADGVLNLTTTYTYTADGLLQAMVTPDGLVMCFEYDTLNRQTRIVQDCVTGGANLATAYAYDLAGNTVYVTDTRSIVTYYEYDALGRVTLTRQDDGGLNLETYTAYDVLGNVISTTAPDGTVTAYSYDAYNRLAQVCQDSEGLNLCTAYGYDRLGRQTVITDAEGIIQRTVYNDFGLSVQEIADANGLAATTVYTYDDLLNLIQVADANGNATQYAYTARGELEQETFADGTYVTFTYDPRGQVRTTTLEDGAIITTTYDAAGRRTQVAFSTGGSQSFAYDPGGRLTQATQTLDEHTTVTGYGYNALGDVVTTTQQLDTGTTWEVRYAYDHIQGTQVVTYPSGAVVTHTLDALGRLDAVQRDATIIADYAYDLLNHVNTVAYPNGLTNYVNFDALGRTTRARVNDGSSDVVDYRYGYDNVGNRTYMQRMHQTGQPAEVYEYDGLYQLVNVWYGADATTSAAITTYAAAQAYALDVLGNRLAVTYDSVYTDTYGPNDGTRSTDPRNQYASVNGDTLSYDLRGNTLFDGVNTYAYNVLNRQTYVTNTLGSARYLYDARGRRVATVQDGITTTHYIYDTQYRVLEERAGDGSLLARYTYGTGMDEPLTLERDGQTYYYHRDALGSITEVSDGSGSIVERYEYDVYGAVTIFDSSGVTLTASAIGNPYLFTGRRYDPESGNYYYRARMYSHRLGRFLSTDPLGFEAGDYNLYRYAFNNPTNLTDPTGEFAFIPWLLKAGAEAAVDALMQATINYFFDPAVTTVAEAINSIDKRQVALAFVTGLLPGGRLIQSAAGAWSDVLLFLLDAEANCEDVTAEQVLNRFVLNLGIEFIGDYVGDLVAEYGTKAVAKGLKKLGLDELAEKVLRQVDDTAPLDFDFCSFSSDTLVMTDEGYVAISDVTAGDYVLAYNEATGEVGYYPVTALWAHEDEIVVQLTIAGETIETTPEHPFYTDKGAWIAAGDLQVGDRVRQADGSYGTVEAVTFERQPQVMYNVTVLGAHTYFVGDGLWLVHNACIRAPLSDSAKNGYRSRARDIWKQLTGSKASSHGWEVHHRIPLEWAHLFPDVEPNRVSNLIGMTNSDHQLVNNMWNTFRAMYQGSTPTAADVMQYALEVDRAYSHLMHFIK